MTQLTKLYIEPTNRCNLACAMCMRHTWDEPSGDMTEDTFAAIMGGLSVAGPPSTIFFGGYGEPLAHPGIIDMVAQTAAASAVAGPPARHAPQVELITNGLLLTESMSRGLIRAGLRRLWVSLDGVQGEPTPTPYGHTELPDVLANLRRFRALRPPAHHPLPEIGMAFVAMRRNVGDLPALLQIASRVGASRFLVTNLLPHTAEMCGEILYRRALNDISYLPSPWLPQVSLPKLDVDEVTAGPLYDVLRSHRNVSLAGNNLGSANDRCPFVEQGAAAIGWDGALSPCLPLLHTHTSYLSGHARRSRRFVVGSLADRSLADLWHDPAHSAFRERVQRFSFAPCSCCGGCELIETNEADCFGSTFPTCGGCLWAQGVIQCP